MSSRRFSLVALLLLLAGVRLHAQDAPSSKEIDALMEKTGYRNQLEILGRQFEASIIQSESDLDKGRVARLKESVAKAFAAERIGATFREHLQATLLREDLEKVSRWSSSPLGMKIRNQETQINFDKYGAVQGDPAAIVGTERWKRIERIDAATGMTAGAFLWMQHAGPVIARIRFLLWGIPGMAENQPAQVAEMDPRLRRVGLLALADSYRGLTDEELDRYLDFAESASGGRWRRATTEAMDLVMTEGAKEVAAAMASLP
jgi:hypothetical protein